MSFSAIVPVSQKSPKGTFLESSAVEITERKLFSETDRDISNLDLSFTSLQGPIFFPRNKEILLFTVASLFGTARAAQGNHDPLLINMLLICGIFSTIICKKCFPTGLYELLEKHSSRWSYIAFFFVSQMYLNLPAIQKSLGLNFFDYLLGFMETKDVIQAYKSENERIDKIKRIFLVLAPTLYGGLLATRNYSHVSIPVAILIIAAQCAMLVERGAILTDRTWTEVKIRKMNNTTADNAQQFNNIVERVYALMKKYESSFLICGMLMTYLSLFLRSEDHFPAIVGSLILLPLSYVLTHFLRKDPQSTTMSDALMSCFPLFASALVAYLNIESKKHSNLSNYTLPLLAAIMGNNLACNGLDLPVSFVEMNHPLFKMLAAASTMKHLGWS